MKAKDKQYGPWLYAVPDRLQKMQVVIGKRFGDETCVGQSCVGLPERGKQSEQQTVGSDMCRHSHSVAETIMNRADVESWKLESGIINEKLTQGKGKPNFEEQLREIDAELSGKADTGCNVGKVHKVRELESEVRLSANKKEVWEGDDSKRGFGHRLNSIGPHGVLDRTKIGGGPDVLINAPA